MRLKRHNRVATFGVLAAGMLLASNAALAQAPPGPTTTAEVNDPICETLFHAYVCGGKINSDVREAAIVLVAARGRENGYWRNVWRTLRETDDEQVEMSCVQIVGRMLAVDGRGREILAEEKRTGQRYGGQWGGPYVVLDEGVVTELLGRVERADNRQEYRIIHYIRALADARDPRTRDFLSEILRLSAGAAAPGRACYSAAAGLLAADGLVRLGEPAGVEWLIQNCESRELLPDRRTPPPDVGQLGAACRAELQAISNDWSGERSTKAQWQAWWQGARSRFPER